MKTKLSALALLMVAALGLTGCLGSTSSALNQLASKATTVESETTATSATTEPTTEKETRKRPPATEPARTVEDPADYEQYEDYAAEDYEEVGDGYWDLENAPYVSMVPETILYDLPDDWSFSESDDGVLLEHMNYVAGSQVSVFYALMQSRCYSVTIDITLASDYGSDFDNVFMFNEVLSQIPLVEEFKTPPLPEEEVYNMEQIYGDLSIRLGRHEYYMMDYYGQPRMFIFTYP
ncbi:MAG: hypothetical protein Q4E01_06225 [Actinomycetaceae bacterium]|nr:hypothetical protein [Actinomycetaceae bacterium]